MTILDAPTTSLYPAATRHLVPAVAERQRVISGGAHELDAFGATVRLSSGRSVLDFGSYAVPLFGHRPEHVLAAVRDALDTMPTSTKLVASPYAVRLAERLAALVAPDRLPRVWFGLNGSDVVEAALKLAVARTGRPSVLAVAGGYHGKSIGALAATADPQRRRAVQGFLGDVRHLEWEPDAVSEAARERPFAALIVEPVQGEGGGRAVPAELLRRWADDVHAAGGYVIADEIQCGMRRCGPVSMAEQAGIGADAILFGKPLGGGVLPLSALVCSEDLFAPLIEDPYFHTATFSGHPASCAAGLAALELGEALEEQFHRASAGVAALVDRVRGHAGLVRAESIGLFGVLEFGSAATAAQATLLAGRRGLLLAPCLTAPAVVRILPPVVTTDQEFATAAEILAGVCRSVGV